MNTSTSTTTCAASLPLDILLKIFTRLPVKSIVRFMCVSKYFYSLINYPFFVDAHRHISLTCPRTSILLRIPTKTFQQVSYIANLNEENDQGKLQANRLRYFDGQRFNNLVTLRSANGLLCLSNDDGDVVICNLSTRQHIFLPRIHSARWQNFTTAVLGFDSVSRTYKVFKSEMCCNHGRGNYSSKQHSVFTLGVDKSWREIVNCVVVPNYPEVGLHVDGVIYLINWIIKTEIIAFDVGTEDFCMIPFPYEFRHCSISFLSSPWIEVDGRLAAVTIDDSQWSSIEIWTLEKSMELWEKQMIPIPLEVSQIIRKAYSIEFTTSCKREIVLLIQVDGSLFILINSYGTQLWRKFEIQGIHNNSICFDTLKNSINVIEENLFFPQLNFV